MTTLLEDAKNSTRWISFDPDKRGERMVADFHELNKSDKEEVAQAIRAAIANGASFDDSADIDEWHKGHNEYVEAKFREYIGALSRTASAAVAGPANFPVAKNIKRQGWADNAYTRYAEAREKSKKRFLKKALPYGDGNAINSDDPNATEKLEAKLADLRARQERMKQERRAARKEKREPKYASYELTNNNANIKRIELRIKNIKRLAESSDQEGEGDGYKYYLADNRLCVEFDKRTSKEVYSMLRSNAWLWSRSNGRFQRKDTMNARGAFRRNILPRLKEGKLFD